MFKKLEKVTLEKTGIHVKVTEGPYTKRELRELLLSSISLVSGDKEDRENKLIRLSDVDGNGSRKIEENYEQKILRDYDQKQETHTAVDAKSKNATRGADGGGKNSANLNLLRSRGISDRLIRRISSNGLDDETTRLLEAMGLKNEDISELVLSLERSALSSTEGSLSKSQESCLSAGSSLLEFTSADGFYLMSNFRNPLTKALRDIASKKPWNPVEYLGHWLLNYKICEERAQRQKEIEEELKNEREKLDRFKVNLEPNVSEADEDEDEEEEEEGEDRNFVEYEAD